MSDPSQGELERLRAIEERHRLLFMNMSAAFVVYEMLPDGAGVVVDARGVEANAAAERMLGAVPGGLAGRTMREVVPFFDPRWLAFIAKVAMTGDWMEAEACEPLRVGMTVCVGFQAAGIVARRGMVEFCQPTETGFTVRVRLESRCAA